MWEFFEAGGPMMWPLLVCSIIALAVILERIWFWIRMDRKGDEAACERILELAQKGEQLPASEPRHFMASMLLAGMASNRADCDKAMEAMALDAMTRMRKGMNILDTMITASPMLGIMGTVLGIISSFDMLGAAGVSDPKTVIAGIAQALITTASGLGIAVVTIFPYNYFNSRIESAQDALEGQALRLEVLRDQQGEKHATGA